MTASMGIPDLGMITVDEVCFFVRQITRATGLPLLVDGDTGYGEALNVMHMICAFEDAGAAAVHIEDQLLPKKCGHLNDKRLAAPVHHRAHGCCRNRRARRCGCPGAAVPRGRRGCHLPRGADYGGEFPPL